MNVFILPFDVLSLYCYSVEELKKVFSFFIFFLPLWKQSMIYFSKDV